MSVEAIAKVIADLRAGHVRLPTGVDTLDRSWEVWAELAANTTVIDCTAIYKQFREGGKAWEMYEDSVMRPPLDQACYAYVNEHGNVIVMHSATLDHDELAVDPDWKSLQWSSEDVGHTIEWDRVKWVTSVTIWVGGWSKTANEPMPTQGPVFSVFIAVYGDGAPADIHWVSPFRHSPEAAAYAAKAVEVWQYSVGIYLQAVTFLNCRNVAVVIPHRRRPIMRALQRAQVEVGEIHVYAVGRTVQGTRPAAGEGGVPAHLVRGHVARYGPEYGRGKLFGKLSGVFWIPVHVRGDRSLGERDRSYKLDPIPGATGTESSSDAGAPPEPERSPETSG